MDPQSTVTEMAEAVNTGADESVDLGVSDIPLSASGAYADEAAEAAFLASMAGESAPAADAPPAQPADVVPAPAPAPAPAAPAPAPSEYEARMAEMASRLDQLVSIVQTMASAQPAATPQPAPAVDTKPREPMSPTELAAGAARSMLGADAPTDLVDEYAEAYRLYQSWAPHQESEEYGQRARTAVSHARATMARVSREVSRERELATLRARVEQQENAPARAARTEQIRENFVNALTPAKLQGEGWNELADAIQAGRVNPNDLLDGIDIDPDDPRSAALQLADRAEVFTKALRAVASAPATPAPTPRAAPAAPAAPRPINPGAIRIPDTQSGSVKDPQYLAGDEAEREFSRFMAERSKLGAGAPYTR